MKRITSLSADIASEMEYRGISRNIKCPLLITIGEHGWLGADRATDLFGLLKTDQRDITLKIFPARETAASEGHVDNPTLANEYIFD
jgi:hypothetical protein